MRRWFNWHVEILGKHRDLKLKGESRSDLFCLLDVFKNFQSAFQTMYALHKIQNSGFSETIWRSGLTRHSNITAMSGSWEADGPGDGKSCGLTRYYWLTLGPFMHLLRGHSVLQSTHCVCCREFFKKKITKGRCNIKSKRLLRFLEQQRCYSN